MELMNKLPFIKKQKEEKKDDKKFLTDSTPYRFTPSFMKHNGKYATIVKLYLRQGSNRGLSYMDVIDFVPTQANTGVEMYFIVDDKVIKSEEKDKLITQNSVKNLAVLEDDEQRAKDKRNKSQQSETQNVVEIRTSEQEDYALYQSIIGKSEVIAVFDWVLLVVGDSPEAIDEQLNQLNTRLKKEHDGAVWDSLPGEQQERFSRFFDELEPDRFKETTVSSNYAGLSVAMSAGLLDERGVPIGKDIFAPSQPTAFFDFENSTRSQAIIAMPKSSVIPFYRNQDSEVQVPASSILAQAAANHIVMNGHRAHHIVLNKFDYFEDGKYYRPQDSERIFKRYDVSKMTINMMQGFGDIKDVAKVYARLQQKIVNIFNVMRNLTLTETQESIISSALSEMYESEQYWIADADLYPERTKIVDIKYPETYATAATFLSSFTTYAEKALREGKVNRADDAETLGNLLRSSLDMYRSVIGRTTTIEPTTALQVYYEFANASSLQLKQIQFLNTIEYIIHTTAKGDVIVIHGCEQLYDRVAKMTVEAINAAKEKGIRFIFAFDTISSISNSVSIPMNDMFKMQNVYYTDLDVDVSWSAVGQLIPNELDQYKKALNTELSDQIIATLQSKIENQVMIHRAIGKVNNFIQLNPII